MHAMQPTNRYPEAAVPSSQHVQPASESLFAQFVRDTDAQFYATFPGAKLAAEQQRWGVSQHPGDYFCGPLFYYDVYDLAPSEHYGTFINADGYSEYGCVAMTSSSAPYGFRDQQVSYPYANYHYPTTQSSAWPEKASVWTDQSSQYPITIINDTYSEPFLDGSNQPSSHQATLQWQQMGYDHPVIESNVVHNDSGDYDHRHHNIDPISPSSFVLSSPSSPSDLASPLTSEPDDYQDRVISRGSRRLTSLSARKQHKTRHRNKSPSPSLASGCEVGVMRFDDLPRPSIVNARDGRVRHYHGDQRHVRSLLHLPSHANKVAIRGMSWPVSQCPPLGSPQSSMRISPPPSKQQPEKKPHLACLFCRGRKIACGSPSPGSNDKTCNQCQRRSLRCEYPSESRRGMRKKKSPETPPAITEKEVGSPVTNITH
ncbi:hypothetical protein B0H34DRAFT_699263 [Crassisporium funariophilum]|nr:hypothetical protein B0H34DRAFT_699263 [Crassisporium funariophilum]